ncbi:MAG: hypothetical protein OEV74_12125, partial [Cyclobacteriaceae bacterium]|nr:hypothetical protein [Cyclobacteriaceae bacterium]
KKEIQKRAFSEYYLRSGVPRLVRTVARGAFRAKVVGSNPVAPIRKKYKKEHSVSIISDQVYPD